MHVIDQKGHYIFFLCLQNIYFFKINTAFELSIHQRILKKKVMVSTKTLSNSTVFNVDYNKKCFLSSKSAY